MNTAPHPPPEPDPPGQDPEDVAAIERNARHLRMLGELGAIGMDLAGQISNTAPWRECDPGLTFARIAKAIRQTMVLENKLAEDHRTRHQRLNTDSLRRANLAQRRRKARLKDAIASTIAAECKDRDDAQDKMVDLHERLNDPDFEVECADRPIGEIAAAICRDLRLPFDATPWTEAELGRETPAPELAPAPDPAPPPPPAAEAAAPPPPQAPNASAPVPPAPADPLPPLTWRGLPEFLLHPHPD